MSAQNEFSGYQKSLTSRLFHGSLMAIQLGAAVGLMGQVKHFPLLGPNWTSNDMCDVIGASTCLAVGFMNGMQTFFPRRMAQITYRHVNGPELNG